MRRSLFPTSSLFVHATLLALGASGVLAADGRTVIHAGSLVDVESGEVLGEHTIVVEGEPPTSNASSRLRRTRRSRG